MSTTAVSGGIGMGIKEARDLYKEFSKEEK